MSKWSAGGLFVGNRGRAVLMLSGGRDRQEVSVKLSGMLSVPGEEVYEGPQDSSSLCGEVSHELSSSRYLRCGRQVPYVDHTGLPSSNSSRYWHHAVS